MTPRSRRGLAALAAALTACASTPRALLPLARPDGEGPPPRIVALADPDVRVSRLGVGWSSVDAEWSALAQRHVRAGVEGALAARGLTAAPLAAPSREEPLAERVMLLDAIGEALSTCGPEHPPCGDVADHGVGSLQDVLPPGADALLVVLASDEISSDGRVMANVALVPVNVALIALAMYAGSLSGFTGIFLRGGETRVRAALLGRDGELVWWGEMRGVACCDLREPGSAAAAVRAALEHFPVPLPPAAAGPAE